MKLSKEAKTILSICWVDDEPRATNFIIGEKYEWKDEQFKPTENTYEELIKYQAITNRPYKLIRTSNVVNITGGRLK